MLILIYWYIFAAGLTVAQGRPQGGQPRQAGRLHPALHQLRAREKVSEEHNKSEIDVALQVHEEVLHDGTKAESNLGGDWRGSAGHARFCKSLHQVCVFNQNQNPFVILWRRYAVGIFTQHISLIFLHNICISFRVVMCCMRLGDCQLARWITLIFELNAYDLDMYLVWGSHIMWIHREDLLTLMIFSSHILAIPNMLNVKCYSGKL